MLQSFEFVAAALEGHHHAKSPQHHQPIRDQREEQGPVGHATAHHEGQNPGARLSDHEPTQHSLDVALDQRHQVRDHDARHPQHRENRGQQGAQIWERVQNDAQPGEDHAHDHTGRHVGGNRGRCPLLKIGQPLVEGNQAEFHREAAKEKSQPSQCQGLVGIEGALQTGITKMSGGPVEKSNAQEQYAARQGIGEKSLKGCFDGVFFPAFGGGKNNG